MIEIREATGGDIAAIRTLLSDARLPFEDVQGDSGIFVVLRMPSPAGALVGTAGLEVFSSAHEGLLRSVVVAPALRGQQVGARLVRAIEERARRWGIQRLWLLTTTAPDFFRRLGYLETNRTQAINEVQLSSEFADICPPAAICLSKAL